MSKSHYQIDLPVFTGPLDLLLHLIERNELDITAISLAQMTEQYLTQVEQMKQERVDELMDFLLIGARLVLIKSRALLPQTPVLVEGDEEEDPAEALVRQLKQYRQFKNAAAALHQRELNGYRTYLRVAPPPKIEGRLDLSGITPQLLHGLISEALAQINELKESVALIQPRRITVEGRIEHVRQTVQLADLVSFAQLLSKETSKVEISVTLLAVLELMKRRELAAHQESLFGPIQIRPSAAEKIGAHLNIDDSH
ncbi:MAG: segregation/condensation protein A [Anaerolineae bacterium]|nr:segregation/condensation protein A [Anaerolineae bacterium]